MWIIQAVLDFTQTHINLKATVFYEFLCVFIHYLWQVMC